MRRGARPRRLPEACPPTRRRPGGPQVEAAATPASIPAARARSVIGSRPPVLRSSCPLWPPSCSTTNPRTNPSGGRCPSASERSSRSICGCLRVRANTAFKRGSVRREFHTPRASTTTLSRITALGCPGFSSHESTAFSHSEICRRNRRCAAVAPCAHGGAPVTAWPVILLSVVVDARGVWNSRLTEPRLNAVFARTGSSAAAVTGAGTPAPAVARLCSRTRRRPQGPARPERTSMLPIADRLGSGGGSGRGLHHEHGVAGTLGPTWPYCATHCCFTELRMER